MDCTRFVAKALQLAFVAVLLACPAAAAPTVNSVSGAVTHGQSITIGGSGFGSFDNADLLLWENFDQGTPGAAIVGQPQAGSWEVATNSCGYCFAPVYSSASSHRGLSSYASSTTGNFHSQFERSMPHNKDSFYVSFWYRYQYPAGGCCQTKLFQLHGTEPWVTDYDPGVMSGGGAGTSWASYIVTDSGQGSTNGYWVGGAPGMNAWHHFEGLLHQSGDGVADGSVVLKNDGATIYQKTNVVTRVTLPGQTEQFWHNLLFFYGFTNFPAGSFVENYVDDAYFTSTWSRVEIGNANTYAGSTHREVQVPSSWSDGSITAAVNRGSFAAGEPLWLYVIDANGDASAGFPLSGEVGPYISGVSGTVEQGQTVTISGGNFGAKASAAPYRWDGFDSGVPGTRLADEASGGWFTDSTLPGVWAKYSAGRVRRPGSQSAYQDFTNGNYNDNIGLHNLPDLTKFYFSGWFYLTTSGAPSRNVKLFYLRNGHDGDTPMAEGRIDQYPSTNSGHLYVLDCTNTDVLPQDWSMGGNLYEGAWHRVESWFDQGTAGNADGRWTLWMDGQPYAQVSGMFINPGTSCPINMFLISWYFATDQVSPMPSAERYWDEMYLDSTQARVEIGNAPTWAASTHREIQVPSAWSGNSISVNVNLGTFSPGSTAYVFVVNGSGNVSSGYPVVVGGSGSPPTPTPSVSPSPSPSPSPAPSDVTPPSAVSTLAVGSGSATYSVFGSNAPLFPWNFDSGRASNLGMKFNSSVSGVVTGARFYKNTSNTGSHAAHLWSSGGTLLASASFVGESASGWQEVVFQNPVSISANTVYVISYSTSTGFTGQEYGFVSGVVSPPLRGLGEGESGSNGVYAWGVPGTFPVSTYRSQNYFVDVKFQTSAGGSNVTSSSVPLVWSAVGDDGSSGTATSYDVRYSTSLITPANFAGAAQATGEPTPHAAGTLESFTVPGLSSGTTYYFALKAADEVPNWGGLSNVVNATTLGSAPLPSPSPSPSPLPSPVPAAPVVSGVSVTPAFDYALVSWGTDVNSDGLVEYSLTPSFGANASNSTMTAAHSVNVSGLSEGALYYYRVWSCANSLCAASVVGNFTTQVRVACSPENETQNCLVGSCEGVQSCLSGFWTSCSKLNLCCGVDCDDLNSCTVDSCVAGTGACLHSGSCPSGGSPGGSSGSSGGYTGGSSGGFPQASMTPSRQASVTPSLSVSPTSTPVRFVEVPETNEEIEAALLELPDDAETQAARAIIAEAKSLESQGKFEAAKALWAKAKERVTALLAKARANKANYNYYAAGIAALLLVGGALYYSSTLRKPNPPSPPLSGLPHE